MIDDSMFFQGWQDVGRVILLGSLGYVGLIFMLRLSRKRTLAHMNVFDFVYIVAVGNILATMIVADSVSFVRGMVALALLIGLQVLMSWLTIKSPTVEHFVNGKPTLLFHRGRFLRDAMHEQRVTEEELLAVARVKGVADLDQVVSIVLETDGDFSVVHFGEPQRSSTLRDVPNADGWSAPKPRYVTAAGG